MADVLIEYTCDYCPRIGLSTKPWCPACPKAPDHRTHEQRILAALEELIRGQRELINLMKLVGKARVQEATEPKYAAIAEAVKAADKELGQLKRVVASKRK